MAMTIMLASCLKQKPHAAAVHLHHVNVLADISPNPDLDLYEACQQWFGEGHPGAN